jgi:hypothetical protein
MYILKWNGARRMEAGVYPVGVSGAKPWLVVETGFMRGVRVKVFPVGHVGARHLSAPSPPVPLIIL